MNRFFADHFAYFFKALGELSVDSKQNENLLLFAAEDQNNASQANYEIERVIRILEILEKPCDEMGLKVSKKKLVQTIDFFRNGWTADYKKTIKNICEIIEFELSDVLFLRITNEKINFYQTDKCLFGQEVANKFPSIIFDIDEAAKCYSLDRTTATVFHLMRVIEKGLESVKLALGAKESVSKNWGTTLKAIKSEMESRGTDKLKKWKSKDQKFFEEAYGSIDAIRNAWRNPTMHVATKYTDDEAHHIFILVKGFMIKLSSRLDETGNPKA